MRSQPTNLRQIAEQEIPTFGDEAASLIGQEPVTARREPRTAGRFATEAVFLALKTLSQRALVALAAIEHLILGGSVFALWLAVIAQPSQSQLTAVGLYSVFVLTVIWLRRP